MFEHGLIGYFDLTWVDAALFLTAAAWCTAAILALVIAVLPGRPPLRSRVNAKGVKEHGLAAWFLTIGGVLSALPALWLLYLLRESVAVWLTATVPLLGVLAVLAVTGWIILRWYIHSRPAPPPEYTPPAPQHNSAPSIARQTYSPIPGPPPAADSRWQRP